MNLLTTILAISFLNGAVDSDYNIWPITWPLMTDGGIDPVTAIQNGYGDWCTILQGEVEGPHPGLDFAADISDDVVNPLLQTCYSLGYGIGNYPEEHILVISPDTLVDYGWTLGHIYAEQAQLDTWHPDSTQTTWSPGDSISHCGIQTQHPWRHLHLSWVEDWNYPPDPGYSVPGYTNPFDHIVADLIGYDEISFKMLFYERVYIGSNSGAWFMPNGAETPGQFSGAPGNPDYKMFQDIVSGAIDIAVSPFSAFQGISDYDSAGVYSVSFEILRQDPISLAYLPAAPDTGDFGQRWLMQMRDELPFGDTDEFRALFLDGNLPVIGGTQYWDRFESAYIVTNSGALDPSSWTTGWDNVWTDTSIVNDWVNGICQGAWDTFLANPEISVDPTQNSEAFFPDGRYAVEVTAVSHGSRDTAIDTLPVNDLSLPDPQVEGIVVDNFLPFIVRVAAYEWDPAADNCHKIYAGYWKDVDPAEVLMEDSEYLESLRAQLHTLQSEDRSNTLQSFCMVDLAESSGHSLVDQYNLVESTTLSPDYLETMSDFEPGCCLDEGIGQDPVEFLMDEIARVENQLICKLDSDRTFDFRVYDYLPMDGQSLVLQVFYSEPTMIENSNGQMITDMLHFEGIIGGATTWLSNNHGRFGRLPRNFQLPLTSDNTAGSEMKSGNTLFDSSYVVHYIFKGALPQEYVGNIQLYFGDDKTIGGGPVDLAWNTMDSDPAFKAETRENYGPFSYVNFSEGPDTNYVWNPPNWHRISNTVYGTVGIEQDLVATVNLNSIGLADAQFLGDCDYWCGFWMYKQNSKGVTVYIVKPDGSTIPFNFSFVSASHGDVSTPTTSDGRYLFMAGHFGSVPGITGSNAIRIDAVEGSVFNHRICKGHAWIAGSIAYISVAELSVVYEEHDNALFSYGYYYAPFPECFNNGEVTLPPYPVSNDISTLLPPLDCIAEISENRMPLIEIQENPARSNLGIVFRAEPTQEYELVIYDITGRRVLIDSGVFASADSRLDIDVSNIPSGVYLLRIRTGDLEVVRTVSVIH